MQLIEGATVKKLKLVADSRGYLMEMLRSDWPEFMRFGQSYVTASYPGIIKAWHYHKLQWDHFVFVHGMARVVNAYGRSKLWGCGGKESSLGLHSTHQSSAMDPTSSVRCSS